MTNENKAIDNIDASKATELVVKYLESYYGNLAMSLFRIEEVRKNGDKTKYFVLCSLITSLGSAKRTYYFFKVDIETKNILSIQKGFRNDTTGQIDWKKENIPPEEE